MISVSTNTAAAHARTGMIQAQSHMESALDRLSSGKRLTSAKDDVAGLGKAVRLHSEVLGLSQNLRNSLDAQSVLGTADNALQEIDSLLQSVRELSVQAANDTYSAADRASLEAEALLLLDEVDMIAKTASWSGSRILDGTYSNKTFQIGSADAAANILTTSISAMTTVGLGIGSNGTTEVDKVGSEFQVNTSTGNTQAVPDIITLSGGSAVVFWQSSHGAKTEVFAQMYDSSGAATGSEFRVNTANGAWDQWQSATALKDGSFVCTWSRHSTAGYEVYGQKFDATGTKIGGEFVITGATNTGYYSDVTALGNGGFAVSWQAPSEQVCQVFDASGTAAGQLVSLDTNMNKVFSLKDGGFGVTGLRNGGTVTQTFDKNGNRTGAEITVSASGSVNSTANGSYTCQLSDGSLVTTFTLGGEVHAQRYDTSGTLMGAARQISANSGVLPKISAIGAEQYLVTWSASDGSDYGVYGQVVDGATETTSGSFLVNTHTTGAQMYGVASGSGSNDFKIVWQSWGQDGDSYGITGQNFISTPAKKINLTSSSRAGTALTYLDAAMATVKLERSKLGATINRLGFAASNITAMIFNGKRSLSLINDSDMAFETTRVAKMKLLTESSTALLAQANSSRQMVLNLLDI
ncbi:MAG: flagellin [Candidatus Puniceispirillaceae bacterium]